MNIDHDSESQTHIVTDLALLIYSLRLYQKNKAYLGRYLPIFNMFFKSAATLLAAALLAPASALFSCHETEGWGYVPKCCQDINGQFGTNCEFPQKAAVPRKKRKG